MSDDIVRREIQPGSQYDRPVRERYRKVTEREKELFLRRLEQGDTVRKACEVVGRSPQTFHSIAARDPEFAEAKTLAMQVGTDLLEEEAWRRAVEGDLEPVIGKVAPGIDGQLTDANGELMWVSRKSDKLLEVMIKGRRPEYREAHKIDVTNQTLNVTVEDRSAALEDVAKIIEEVRGRAGNQIGDGSGGVGEVISDPGLLLAESEELHS